MRLEEAVKQCHIDSYVYRLSKPKTKFYKDAQIEIGLRVPYMWKDKTDWEFHINPGYKR